MARLVEPVAGAMGGFHPSLAGYHAGGFSSFHPALSGLRAGGYGGIHTGGRMIGAAYGRVHYRPSVGYYHPNAPAAAALGNYLNYQMTYDSLNPYYADPYYHRNP
jgi:hypothetical protein